MSDPFPSPILLRAEVHLLFRGFMPTDEPRHDHDELLAVLRGRFRCHHEGRLLVIEPGQALWIPAGTTHHPLEPEPDRQTDLLYAAFTCPATTRPDEAVLTPLPDLRGRLAAILLWMSEAAYQKTAAGRAQADHLLAALLAEVRQQATRPDRDRFTALLDFIADHLHSPLTVGEMARFINLSRRHLERLFHRRCGCTPRAWLRRLRLEKALHLHATGQTLAQIAPQVGRRSLAHLSRELSRQPRRGTVGTDDPQTRLRSPPSR